MDLYEVLSNSAATSCDRAFVVLWGVDVVLLDSIVAVPKSSFVTRQTATLASISVPPAGPFARRPRACPNKMQARTAIRALCPALLRLWCLASERTRPGRRAAFWHERRLTARAA